MNMSDNVNITKQYIILFLQKNKTFLSKEFGLTKVALFGSYSRGDQTNKSDIDLAIETTNISFKNYCKLKYFLEENLKKNVDLCYLNNMRTFIKYSTEKEMIYA